MLKNHLLYNIYEPIRILVNRKDDYANGVSGGSGTVATITATKAIVKDTSFEVIKGATIQAVLEDIDDNIKYLVDDNQINIDNVTVNSGQIQANKIEIDQLITEMDSHTEDLARHEKDIATSSQDIGELKSEIDNVITPDLKQLFEMQEASEGLTIVDKISILPVSNGAKVVQKGHHYNWFVAVFIEASKTIAKTPVDSLDYKVIEEFADGVPFTLSKDAQIKDADNVDADGNPDGSYDYINNNAGLEFVKTRLRITSTGRDSETVVNGIKDLFIRGLVLYYSRSGLPGNEAQRTIWIGFNGKERTSGFIVDLDTQPDYHSFIIPIGDTVPMMWWYYQGDIIGMCKLTITRSTANKYAIDKLTPTSSKFYRGINDSNKIIKDRDHLLSIYNDPKSTVFNFDTAKVIFEHDGVKAGDYRIDDMGNMVRATVVYATMLPNDFFDTSYHYTKGNSVTGEYTKLGADSGKDLHLDFKRGTGMIHDIVVPDPALFTGKFLKITVDPNLIPASPLRQYLTVDKWKTEYDNYPIDPVDPDKYRFIILPMTDGGSELILYSNGTIWERYSNSDNVDFKVGTP